MKLIDICIQKNFKNQTLKDGNFYVVLEQKDVFSQLFMQRRFSLSAFEKYEQDYAKYFAELTQRIVSKLSEKLGEEHVQPEEEIICYMSDTDKMSMCLRCFIIDIEDEAAVKNCIDELKAELLKDDIYLKIKF